MLDASLKEQVRSIFSGLKADYTFDMDCLLYTSDAADE